MEHNHRFRAISRDTVKCTCKGCNEKRPMSAHSQTYLKPRPVPLSKIKPEPRKLTYDELYNLFERTLEHVDSLDARLQQELMINARYREWFTRHEYLVNHAKN